MSCRCKHHYTNFINLWHDRCDDITPKDRLTIRNCPLISEKSPSFSGEDLRQIQALWMPNNSWEFLSFFLLLMFWRLHFNAKCPHSKLGDEYWWMGVSRLKLNQSWPWNFHIFWCVDSLKERCVCDDISMFLFFKGVESFEKWNLKVQKWYVCIYEYIYIYTVYFSTLFFSVIWKGENSLQTLLGPCFYVAQCYPLPLPGLHLFQLTHFLLGLRYTTTAPTNSQFGHVDWYRSF